MRARLLLPGTWALMFLALSAQANPSAELTELLGRLDAIRDEERIAGLGLVIVDAQSIQFAGGLGVEDWQSQQPLTADSYIRIGSVSKAFTGLTFLALDRDGVLALDTQVPEKSDPPLVDNPWRDQYKVTIAQLLEHTAGLTDLSKREFDHNVPLPLADALRIDPSSRTLKWPPGRHSSYSNAGAGVAAHAMELLTGLDFEAEARTRVFTPLGMISASFSLSPEIERELVTGYNTDGKTPIPYWHTLYRPFGGINVRLKHMAPFLRMLLGRGQIDGRRIFSEQQIQRMENPETTLAAGNGLTFGYGLGNYHAVRKGFVFHVHGGDADGYLSHFGYNLDTGIGYFIVINAFRNSSLSRLKNEVMDFVIRDHKARFALGVPQAIDHLASLTGAYRSVGQRFSGAPRRGLNIKLDNGRLYLVRGERRQHLIPQSPWQYRRPFEPVATTAFITVGADMFLQGPFGNFRRIAAPDRD